MYNQDGLKTLHNSSFMNEPHFRKAYEYTRSAIGRDFFWHWRNYIGITLASKAKDYGLNFVECGVGQGWMTMSILHYMWHKYKITPYFTLFDTWDGIDETLVSSEEEEFWGMKAKEKKETYKYIKSSFEETRNNIVKTAHDANRIQFVRGSIPFTMTTSVIEDIARRGPISFLHIDMNNAYPEVQAFTLLHPLIEKGGIVLFDDYAYSGYEYQHLKINEACESRGLERPIALPTGQGLYIKI